MDHRTRVTRLAGWLASQQLSAAVFVDVEERRDRNLRYLTGHPADALLFVLAGGKSILVPWDINLARNLATADEIVPYTDFNRSLTTAVEAVIAAEHLTGPIEVSAATPHPVFEELRKLDGKCEIVCRSGGLDETVAGYRLIKDADELERIERAAAITNELLELLEDYLARSGEVSEVEVALLLEREARRRGSEGMAFDSLVAGSRRSYGIHAFPSFTEAPFGGAGMSILDFGVLVDGYPSDVTTTVLRGALDAKQEKMVALVTSAYEQAVAMARIGTECREIAAAVDALFEGEGFSMPHSLGHGLGLQVHERPYVRNKAEARTKLSEGMIFTIEPGLYDPEAGGVRLENDLVMTPTGARVLTTSRILRLP